MEVNKEANKEACTEGELATHPQRIRRGSAGAVIWEVAARSLLPHTSRRGGAVCRPHCPEDGVAVCSSVKPPRPRGSVAGDSIRSLR